MRQSLAFFTPALASSSVSCALTGKIVDDWPAHCRSFDMRLFALLRDRFTSPTAPLPANRLYAVIANPCRLIDEFARAKTTRRLGRLRTSLGFLRRHNVLLHSLLFYAKETQTWNTTEGFGRLALFGEGLLRHEVRARILRLFPSVDSSMFTSLCERILCEDALCSLFDQLSMKSLVGAKPDGRDRDWSLTREQRTRMFCALVAEMSWFASRTKATDRTHNNALFPPSDALILHVLCCHLLESLPAELIYTVLEPRIQRIKEVWVNEPMSIPEQLHLKPRTVGALSLSHIQRPISKEERRRKAEAQKDVLCGPLLSSVCVVGSVRSTMKPRWNFKRFNERRYQILAEDKRCCLPLHSSPSPREFSEVVTVSLSDERRRELLSSALKQE